MDQRVGSIIHEDQWFVAVNKEVGVAVQPSRNDSHSVMEELSTRFGSELWVVHRIDQPVSGLVIFARTAQSAAEFSVLIREQLVARHYWAIVSRQPDPREGRLEHHLIHRPGSNKSEVTGTGGKRASLTYRTLGGSDRYWLLDVELHTGRHHQIRVQLSAIGCPVRGDLKYGAKRSNRGGGISLHARSMEFTHPATGQPVSLVASPPDDTLWKFFLEQSHG